MLSKEELSAKTLEQSTYIALAETVIASFVNECYPFPVTMHS